MRRKVFTDANVLWSPQQRNLILQLASEELFDVYWTDEIVQEWLRNVDDDQRAKSVNGTLPLMRRHFPLSCLPSGHDRPVGRTDAKDRHVAYAAAAIAPSVLLTWNVRDFDRAALRDLSVELSTPDEFLSTLFDETPEYVFEVVRRAQANLTKSARTWEAYLEVLKRKVVAIGPDQEGRSHS